jgi:RND family efflux transporter MFP subunit
MVDLISPIDGVVTMVNATLGSTAIPGVPLATVAAIDRVRIRSYVGHEEITQLEVGQKAFIKTASSGRTGSGPSTREEADWIEGTISKVSLSADPETNLFLIEVTAENSEGKLKPGIVAVVSALVEEKQNVVKVPVNALMSREEGNFIYVVRSKLAHLEPVMLGVNNGDFVEILEGASVGDTLVVRGQYRLSDGAPVKIHRFEGAN